MGSEGTRRVLAICTKCWLLLFFVATVVYLELVLRLWVFRGISLDFVFPLLFSVTVGAILFVISSIYTVKINRVVSIIVLALLSVVYAIQLVYYSVFKTPLSLFSLTGAGDVLQFKSIILEAILNNCIAILLVFIPLVTLIIITKKHSITCLRGVYICIAVIFFLISHLISLLCLNLTKDKLFSQYELYHETMIPDLSVKKLGIMTTMRLDLQQLISAEHIDVDQELPEKMPEDSDENVSNSVYNEEAVLLPSSPIAEPTASLAYVTYQDNVLNIDFDALIAEETDNDIIDMHKYFSSLVPTIENEYTGAFKGSNLIMITAEAFSPYVVSEELTPTLYMMANEGFVFKNFYTPIWGVSTSDGEYVACTGLIPKSGVWSFSRSGENYMPFAMGNQLKALGYTTKAYHNHSYKYYDRHLSHPNMGYEYKGVGNGLDIKKTWPESDLEMIEVTADEYIGLEPFHTYYMTVSGHLNYSFTGNSISSKNRAYVDDMSYSAPCKAYLACNLELEFAMKALIEKLEASGVAENTVIAISPDHYPYGLAKENIDELAGHEVEGNFELYKGIFILWKKGMEPVVVDKPCSSLDIMPTLSNLFGLEYDSRLFMGTDIFSESDPLVIFSNRSWITDKAFYNTPANSVEYVDGVEPDIEYVKMINKIVSDKFKYSAKILETDYYNRLKLKGTTN